MAINNDNRRCKRWFQVQSTTIHRLKTLEVPQPIALGHWTKLINTNWTQIWKWSKIVLKCNVQSRSRVLEVMWWIVRLSFLTEELRGQLLEKDLRKMATTISSIWFLCRRFVRASRWRPTIFINYQWRNNRWLKDNLRQLSMWIRITSFLVYKWQIHFRVVMDKHPLQIQPAHWEL